MSLRIAFDLDGTLADLHTALDRIAEELFPSATSQVEAGVREDKRERKVHTALPEPKPESSTEARREGDALTSEEEQLEPPEVRALTRQQQKAIWDRVRHTVNFWETLSETEPGIVSRIAAIADERRWEVIFLTQRPPADGDTTQRQSQQWLAKHGFHMPSVYVLGADASRGKVAAALSLDVVVDDRPENCLDVKVDSPARAFLVERRSAATVGRNAERLGIDVVPTVGACLDLLTARTAEARGLLGRIKKVLGPKA